MNENITIRNTDKIVTGNTELVELFNSLYINLVEKTQEILQEIERNPELKYNNQSVAKSIAKCESHSSIVNIKNSTTNKEHLDIPAAITDVINKIIEELNWKKGTGPNKVLPKSFQQMLLASHLTNIIRILQNIF